MFLFAVLPYVLTLIGLITDVQTEMRNVGHVVLITSPFFGHMIPLLDLAKRLSQQHHVTYVGSASKLDMLKQRGFLQENEIKNTDSIYTNLDLIGLFDGNDDDFEVTNTGTRIQIQSMLDRMHDSLLQLLFPASNTSSSSSMLPSTRLFATGTIRQPFDLVISDLFVLPPVLEAYKRNITTYFFIPNNLMALMHYINMSIDKIKSDEFGLNFDRQMYETIPLAKGLICNSILELDEQVLNELRQSSLPGFNISILFVAPLIAEDFRQQQHTIISAYVKQWLDAQWERANKSQSVIYISFGSWARLSFKQLVEIASALKQHSYIWSLKTKSQIYISSSSWIDSRQHLLLDWAPQRFILSHPAIRLFISHGGWNSLLESMVAGKPMLVWPLFGDQMINGHRLEHEFGMGRYIQNTHLINHQSVVSSDELQRYLNDVFTKEKEYARKARQVQQMVLQARENSSKLYLEEIIKTVDKRMTIQIKEHNEL